MELEYDLNMSNLAILAPRYQWAESSLTVEPLPFFQASKGWDNLGLSSDTLEKVRALGFASPTPVQAACIPLLLKRKDVSAEAATGSGKTLAFTLPICEILTKDSEKLKPLAALIVSPTRELAQQTHQVIKSLKYPQLRAQLITGGHSIQKDVEKFEKMGGAHIVVGTPGRLADVLSARNANNNLCRYSRNLEVLILDEADRLLELGFDLTLGNILAVLPKQRRTGLFSATQTKQLDDLKRAGLRNPVTVSVKEKHNLKTPIQLQNYICQVEPEQKLNTLLAFLKQYADLKVMVFLSTCATVQYFQTVVSKLLPQLTLFCLHGKMRNKRQKVFAKFSDTEKGVLLCTDVMARGVDIPRVDWVIQYDPPLSGSVFVHRCGRTARMGNEGSALVFLMPNELSYAKFLTLNQSIKLDPIEVPKNVEDHTDTIRRLEADSESIYIEAMRSFVSYIQSYRKHECSLLFRIEELEFGRLAMGYALLKMPYMPELKNKKLSGFRPPTGIHSEHLEAKRNAKELEGGKKRRKKKRKEPEGIPQNMNPSAKRRLKAKMRVERELDELYEDERLIKREKLHKITKEEFEEKFLPNGSV